MHVLRYNTAAGHEDRPVALTSVIMESFERRKKITSAPLSAAVRGQGEIQRRCLSPMAVHATLSLVGFRVHVISYFHFKFL